jgi:surfactin synthase thioesterase subunit/acyl-CoA synthetase (AMP-forming)/AMP-acid ligase II
MSDVLALLQRRADARAAVRLYFPDADAPTTLAELLARGRLLADSLSAQGIGPGRGVGILARRGDEFLITLAGAWYVGAVPVALPLPFTAFEEYARHIRRMATAAGIRQVVTGSGLGPVARRLEGALPQTVFSSLSDRSSSLPAGGRTTPGRVPTPAGRPAFLQFTSGSTSVPKPVLLSHRNVVAGLEAIALGLESGGSDVLGTVLPLYHDMGIFASLHALLFCRGLSVWPVQAFLRDPAGWLAHFTAVGGTQVPAPPFVLRALLGAADRLERGERDRVDLSAWKAVVHGSDGVDHELLDRFADRFGPLGLRRTALLPAYGLAEATVAVAFSRLGRGPVTRCFDRTELAVRGRARELSPGLPGGRVLTSLGRPVPGIEVRISAAGEREEGKVGEIEIRGASVAGGQLAAPVDVAAPACEAATTTYDGWRRTGDLGFQKEGELYLLGRMADTVRVGGAVWMAEDIEGVVSKLPGIWRGHCVAFSVDGGVGVGVECALPSATGDTLADQVASLVTETFGIGCVRVWRLGPGELPRTSSGKWRRSHARNLLGGPERNDVAVPVNRRQDAVAADRWRRVWLARPAAALRLYCFPFAGGDAAYYRPWAEQLPETVEVRAVQLPGRLSRREEPPLDSFHDLIDALAMALGPELGERPSAFFGHSFGALLAFEAAREIRRRQGVEPGLLMVSGALPPDETATGPARTLLRASDSDDDLWKAVRSLGGVPDAVAVPELRELFLPQLRADLRAIAGYRYRPQLLLGCHISVLGGRSDALVPEPALRGWGRHGASVSVRTFPGGHFYLDDRREVLLAVAGEAVRRLVGAPAVTG